MEYYKIWNILKELESYKSCFLKGKDGIKKSNEILEGEKKEHTDKYTLQDANLLYYEEQTYYKDCDKPLEVKNIENVKQNSYNKLGCEVDIPIDKIIAFIHKDV